MIDLIRPLPSDPRTLTDWEWERIEPYYARLEAQPLTTANVNAWLADWTQLSTLVDECHQRLYVATTQNTADEKLNQQFDRFIEQIYPRYQSAEQTLKQKLLESGLEPAGFDIPLRNLRAEAALFRQENLPLETREQKLEKEYDRIIGGETVQWQGAERTPTQMLPVLQSTDRALREQAWRLMLNRRLANRQPLNDLWREFVTLRLDMAKHADYTLPGRPDTGDYRAYRWQEYLRFDYTPADCRRFAEAIEEVVVPAASQLYQKYQQRLGVDTLRPWDLQGPMGFFVAAEPPGTQPLQPYQQEKELMTKTAAIFHAVDPQLGDYFDTMRQRQLLDLPNRKGKAPGGYCISFEHTREPFIFMNTIGVHDDVQTLLHEAGHAFHAFESYRLPYAQQHVAPIEFCEVASMSMEFLGAPFFNSHGGFYSDADAARARIEKLETAIFFWPYMAVTDGFQHWAYENPEQALDPQLCDATWGALWERFMQGVDWSGLEQERVTGWHRKPHIFTSPFYYVEYGMAQLGAVQVWANARRDPAQAVRDYRRALALGGTAALPQLFETAGAQFKFDAPTLRLAVELMLETIDELSAQAHNGALTKMPNGNPLGIHS